MEVMTAVEVLGVFALIAAVVAWVTWHRGADERQSVQHHQHTLATLRHVADRNQPSVSPAPRRRRSSENGRSGSRPVPTPTPKRRFATLASTRHVSRSGAGLPQGRGAAPTSARESARVDSSRRETVVFDDAIGLPGGDRRGTAPSAVRRRGARLPGGAEQARREGRARVRRTRFVAAAAVIIVAGVVGGALALGGSHNPTRAASRGATHPARPLTAAGGATSTTTVVSADLTPAGATAFSARYAAPSSTYTVAINASALCWVMATDPLTGKVVWTGTIAAGASHAVPVSGSLYVQLGAPTDASVTLDGRPVQLPANFRSPFTLEFGAAS